MKGYVPGATIWLLSVAFGYPQPRAAQTTVVESFRVVPVFFVPRDMGFTRDNLALQIRALDDVRDWYARSLRGPTFRAEPFVVQRSRHTFGELAGNDFQNWWPLPAAEFAAYGLPWNERSVIKLLIIAHGAGAWAGADSENGGIDSIADAGRLPKGNLGGLAVIGDSSVTGVLARVCPREGESSYRKPEGGTAWWCNWNTYRGTVAHELGHTWGLPHPDAFRQGLRCDSTLAANMQCHWAWPSDSLIPYEAAHLRSLDHFADRQGEKITMLSSLGGRVLQGRMSSVNLERGDSLLWATGRGAGTGYPWGILVSTPLTGQSASVVFRIPRSTALEAELGRPPGDTGIVRVRITAGSRPLFVGEIRGGTYPLRLVLPVRQARDLTLEVTGAAGSSAVFGNARVHVSV